MLGSRTFALASLLLSFATPALADVSLGSDYCEDVGKQCEKRDRNGVPSTGTCVKTTCTRRKRVDLEKEVGPFKYEVVEYECVKCVDPATLPKPAASASAAPSASPSVAPAPSVVPASSAAPKPEAPAKPESKAEGGCAFGAVSSPMSGASAVAAGLLWALRRRRNARAD